MSKESEAIELLREWRIKWVGEFANRDGTLSDRTDVFLSKHDIMKCHCGGEVSHCSWKGDNRIVCDRCGHAGKSSRSQEGAKKNWEFTQEAIREKHINDRENRRKCSKCGINAHE